ncbi:MAG TPA: choice-of-anchor tandem repeat GloVer-containing protein, partial [Candidatus Acidoferrales bacterium]|nr:choice-of-anchor tandem repeat GloVer-containing protein [Candidatus Acidoferrales bacterium]
MNAISASLVLAACLFTVTSAGATDTLSVIHKFVGGNDGDDPNSLIQASDGNFYGTTYLGVGTVFQVTPAGQFTTVFDLPPQNPNRY